ncbi:hypothetical protein, partial [Pyramidobacter sp.]|uniref:hypothetical protein n=1 Tax=Pyramidobacter sp. TaxID=1943581 RepID=UPI0033293E51
LLFFSSLSPLENLRLKIFAQKSPARCGKSFPPRAGLFYKLCSLRPCDVSLVLFGCPLWLSFAFFSFLLFSLSADGPSMSGNSADFFVSWANPVFFCACFIMMKNTVYKNQFCPIIFFRCFSFKINHKLLLHS